MNFTIVFIMLIVRAVVVAVIFAMRLTPVIMAIVLAMRLTSVVVAVILAVCLRLVSAFMAIATAAWKEEQEGSAAVSGQVEIKH